MCLEVWSTYIPWALVQEPLRASGGEQIRSEGKMLSGWMDVNSPILKQMKCCAYAVKLLMALLIFLVK